ncbi:MAG: hypothetical protein O3A00_25445, partial [Planctomycetota bacterium]|nr:hypothetical protein [Planctomycetota bacterium]
RTGVSLVPRSSPDHPREGMRDSSREGPHSPNLQQQPPSAVVRSTAHKTEGRFRRSVEWAG